MKKVVSFFFCAMILCAYGVAYGYGNPTVKFDDPEFEKIVRELTKNPYQSVWESDLNLITEFRTEKIIKLSSITKLHDFTRVYMGKKNTPYYAQGIVVNHTFMPGQIMEDTQYGSRFIPGLMLGGRFLAGAFLEINKNPSNPTVAGALFIPGEILNDRFVPGMRNAANVFKPGFFTFDGTSADFYKGMFSHGMFKYGDYSSLFDYSKVFNFGGLRMVSRQEMYGKERDCGGTAAWKAWVTKTFRDGFIAGAGQFALSLKNGVPFPKAVSNALTLGAVVVIAKEGMFFYDAFFNEEEFQRQIMDPYACPASKPVEVTLDPIDLTDDENNVVLEEIDLSDDDDDDDDNKDPTTTTPNPMGNDPYQPSNRDPVFEWVHKEVQKALGDSKTTVITKNGGVIDPSPDRVDGTIPDPNEDPIGFFFYLMIQKEIASLNPPTSTTCPGGVCPDYGENGGPRPIDVDAARQLIQGRLSTLCSRVSPSPDGRDICNATGRGGNVNPILEGLLPPKPTTGVTPGRPTTPGQPGTINPRPTDIFKPEGIGGSRPSRPGSGGLSGPGGSIGRH